MSDPYIFFEKIAGDPNQTYPYLYLDPGLSGLYEFTVVELEVVKREVSLQIESV